MANATVNRKKWPKSMALSVTKNNVGNVYIKSEALS